MEGKKKEKDLQFIAIYTLFYDKKYDQVIKKASKFLEKYPYNKRIRYFKGISHRILKEYDKAIEELKYNVLTKDNLSFYIESCFELFFIYYNLRMYSDAYKLIDKLENKIDDPNKLKNFEIAKIIIYNKLGINKKTEKYGYIQKQLNNYSKAEAIKHLNLHKGKQEERCYFYDNVNIIYLYDVIKENIKNIQKCNIDFALDAYYFSIGNIGFDSSTNNSCSILKVLTIPETSNIVTMYPIIGGFGEFATIDLNYDVLFSKKGEKVKTLSQIDKFNKRYNKR